MNAAEQLIEQGRAEGLEKGRAEGLQRGVEKGLRTAIAAALSARSVPLSELARARLEACTDVGVLTRWLSRAVMAATEAEVFAADTGAVKPT